MNINEKDIRTNFHKCLQKHSIILIDRTDEKKPRIGSAVFFEYNSNFFILTAKHVIENVKDDDLLICLGMPEQRYALKKEKIWFHDYLDLAYIQLNRAEATLGRGPEITPFVIQDAITQNVIAPKLRHAICGFPSEVAKVYEYKKMIATDYYLLTTRMLPYEEWPKDLDSRTRGRLKNSKEDFLLLLDDGEAINLYGKKRKIREIYGMSGAGVWVYDPTTENENNPSYFLYGIQSGIFKKAYRSYSLLSGSIVEPIISQIKKVIK